MSLHRTCQTSIWGPRQSRRFESIVRIAAEAGFEGLEIDFDRLSAEEHERLRGSLQTNGMKLSAVHFGKQRLGESPRTAEAAAEIGAVLDFMDALDVPLLVYSGWNYRHAKGIKAGLRLLNQAASACRDRNRRLLYHVRIGELEQTGGMMEALRQDTSPDVGFCPNVGWLYKAGIPIVGFLMELRERLGAVHLSDFHRRTAGEPGSAELGSGGVPLTKVTAWLRRTHLPDLWVVAEQNTCKGFPGQAVRRNGAFLIQELGRCGRGETDPQGTVGVQPRSS